MTDREIMDAVLKLGEQFKEPFDLSGQSYYQQFMEGLARKSYWHLLAIHNLGDDPFNADAVLDLSRSVFEFMIWAIYANTFGKDKIAEKFILFSHIEVWSDVLYAQKVGISLPDDNIAERKKDYEQLKTRYIRPSKKQEVEQKSKKIVSELKKIGVAITPEQESKILEKMSEGKSDEEIVNKTPLGMDLETMMHHLNDKGVFPAEGLENFGQVYIFGNRKNHASPTDVDALLGSAQRVENNHDYNMNIGVTAALLGYISVLQYYADAYGMTDLRETLNEYHEKYMAALGLNEKSE